MERNNSGSTSSSSFYVSMYNSQTVVFQSDISGLIKVKVVLCPPDVVRTLLSILEFEGPFLTTVGAQL